LLIYDKKMRDVMTGMAAGHIRVPKYTEIVNPPSLLAYYQTLPAFCRDSPLVRNVLYAFEYHKPGTDIRDKELAMNYMCSFLRPIEGRMLDVIAEAASSSKVRLNMAIGKEMMNDLKYYELDQVELGEISDEEDDGSGDADISALLQKQD